MRAKSWVKELQRQASANIIIALAGNKLDLANQRQVETDVRESPATFPFASPLPSPRVLSGSLPFRPLPSPRVLSLSSPVRAVLLLCLL